MKEPLYSQSIAHSWRLIWQHKMLWIFGLFAALLGQMGILDFLANVTVSSSQITTSPPLMLLTEFLTPLQTGYTEVMSADRWVWFAWVLLVLIAAVVFFVFVSVVSHGALIHASAQSVRSKKMLNTSTAWDAGLYHFWRLFAITAVKKIIILILSAAVGWATINVVLEGGVGDTFLFLFIFLLACVVGFLLSFLAVYAAGYVVVEEYSFGEALAAAWKLFKDHWLVSIEVGGIILLCNLGVTILVLLGLFLFFVPAMMVWVIAMALGSGVLFVGALVVSLILATIFTIFLASLLSAFTTSVWTYLFMKMHKHGVHSRILHWLGHRYE